MIRRNNSCHENDFSVSRVFAAGNTKIIFLSVPKMVFKNDFYNENVWILYLMHLFGLEKFS